MERGKTEGKEAVEDGARKKGKREKGYAQLDRGSSEEELVSKGSSSSGKGKKGGKMFGKLHGSTKGKEKTRRRSGSPISKKKGSLPGRVVIGIPLEEAGKLSRSHDGISVPAFVRKCIDYVEEKGLTTEGIYRISPPKSTLEELRDAANAGARLRFGDPHEAAGLLKLFLRELPDHILTSDFVHQFEKAAGECPCKTTICTCLSGDRISALLKRLPLPNYHLLAYLFIHIQNVIKREEYNKMGLPGLGLVLQPTLSISQRLLAIFIRNTRVHQKQATSLFSDVKFKRYVGPLRPPPEKLTQQLPSSRKDIEEELEKQQSLLDELHLQMADLRSAGEENPAKEQELWEVQMVATQLKRKLKAIRQKDDPQEEITEEQGPCIELFEEKQLLAVQTELKDRIHAEKKLIAALEKEIREAEAAGLVEEIDEESPSEDEETDWKSKEKELRMKNQRLISEIVQERERCARLRAEIELITNNTETMSPKKGKKTSNTQAHNKPSLIP